MLKKPGNRLWLLLLCSVTVHAETLTGKVVKITDGDTLVILDASNTQHRIQLAGIDAPEAKPFRGTAGLLWAGGGRADKKDSKTGGWSAYPSRWGEPLLHQ